MWTIAVGINEEYLRVNLTGPGNGVGGSKEAPGEK